MILSWLRQKIQTEYPTVQSEVSVPPDSKLGDYSSNVAFLLAKDEKRNPLEAGQEIIDQLLKDPQIELMFEKIEIVKPGFINFFLKPNYLRRQLANIHNQGPKFGRSSVGEGKTVIVEYSSVNIAKPMHVGHLRTTLIGDALANIYSFLGYDVVRWNYLGDWGTQFGKLIAAYKRWGKKEDIERAPIATLLELYVKFHEALKTDTELETEGQKEFKKLEEGDTDNKKIWKWFRDVSLKEFNNLYKQLGVTFDVWKGESTYEADLKPLIEFLRHERLVKESEGALIFDLEQFKLPPVIVRKSDGASTYFTREIATLQHRLDEYEPMKIVYVVGNEQSLHFQQLFAVAQLLGLETAELTHVKYGLVLGEEGQKFATREGRVIAAADVLKKAVTLAQDVVAAKNPTLSEEEKSNVAEAVGVGALKYNDLMEHRNSDIVFDWKKMLDFSGNSGPYLQYTYARLASIRRKAGGAFFRRFLTPNLKFLEHEGELRLMRHLLNFPETIQRSAYLQVTNNLALYLYELANYANRYYEEVRILDDTERRDARVYLLESVMSVLERGLRLLGIRTLERM
jgi:arginyl-tRNA synthetase